MNRVPMTGDPVDAGPEPTSDRLSAQTVDRALMGTAALVWIGLYSFYLKVWLLPRSASHALDTWVAPIVHGNGAAPYQYRFLVPDVLNWLHQNANMTIGNAEVVVDGLALAVGATVLVRIFRQLDLAWLVLPASLFCGYLGLGLLWWGKFETLTAFAALTVATWNVVAPNRSSRIVFPIAILVLVGSRTDLVAAVGVAYLVRGWLPERERGDRAWGVGLIGLAAAATIALKAIYPDAHYDKATGLVQIVHNLHPAVLLTALAFLAPALIPVALLIGPDKSLHRLRAAAGWLVPLAALVAAEIVFTFAVGRSEEVRLLFPLAAPLALVGTVAWRDTIRRVAVT